MTTTMSLFRGVDAHGAGRTGVVPPGDLATWIERRFTAGWRNLTVRRTSDNIVIGGISGRGQHRGWWSE